MKNDDSDWTEWTHYLFILIVKRNRFTGTKFISLVKLVHNRLYGRVVFVMKFTPEKRCPLNPMLLLNSMLIEISIENGNQIVKYCDLDNLMIILMNINSSEPYIFT